MESNHHSLVLLTNAVCKLLKIGDNFLSKLLKLVPF
jgi:hypothetical protein